MRPLLALVLALGAFGLTPSAAQRAAVVTLAHINDLHEMNAAHGGAEGGLARVATVVDELRRRAAPVIVTLGGDFLSPSAIGTARVDGQPLAGRQAIAALNLTGIQWATFGNHEFDITETAFRERLREARFGIVSSNVSGADGAPFPGVPRSVVHTVSANRRTIRIGLIGVTIDFNRRPWVKYDAAIDAARREVAALRGQVDALVAITHLTLAEDEALAAGVPEIDLILGGHEHDNWVVRRGPGFTPIVKADANGRSVAVVTMTFGDAGSRPTVAAGVRTMDAAVPPHAGVQREIVRWTRLAFDAFRRDGFDPDAVVAATNEPLDGRDSTVRHRAGTLTDLITDAMAREANTDIALLNGGSIRIDDVIRPGPLTQYDVIRILPFGGAVLRATIAGALLGQVLDAGAQNQGSGGYLHARGIARQDGVWIVQGQPLDPSRRYDVALPEFLLSGGETRMAFLTRTHPQVHDVRTLRDVRQALISALTRRLHASSVIAFSGKPASRAVAITCSTFVSATSQG